MYYFIVNPASGSSRGHTVWNTVRTELDRNHISYKAFLLSHRGEARVLAASLAQRKQPFTLVVVGGDGTINETSNPEKSVKIGTLRHPFLLFL